MPSGGARAKAGRMPDPSSEAFQQRAAGLFALPANGYRRPHPKFPLPRYVVWFTFKDDDGFHREPDDAASAQWNERERDVWNELWRYPAGVCVEPPAVQVPAAHGGPLRPPVRAVRVFRREGRRPDDPVPLRGFHRAHPSGAAAERLAHRGRRETPSRIGRARR